MVVLFLLLLASNPSLSRIITPTLACRYKCFADCHRRYKDPLKLSVCCCTCYLLCPSSLADMKYGHILDVDCTVPPPSYYSGSTSKTIEFIIHSLGYIYIYTVIYNCFVYSTLMDVINVTDLNKTEDYMHTYNSGKKKKNY